MAAMTTAAAADPDKRAPGRPRSARSEQAIIHAVLTMISDGVPIETLSVESIAARAGVGKATIYRRWSSKEQLVVDAVASLKVPVPTVAGESVREDLITLLSAVGRTTPHSYSTVLNCLILQLSRAEELYQAYQNMIEPRREALRQVLRRGIEAGELRPDLDIEVAIMQLAAPLVLQRSMNWNPSVDGGNLAERLVDAVLAGAVTQPNGR